MLAGLPGASTDRTTHFYPGSFAINFAGRDSSPSWALPRVHPEVPEEEALIISTVPFSTSDVTLPIAPSPHAEPARIC